LFASAYDVYDRISEHYQRFLETLTATFSPVGYSPNPEHAHLYQVERGSPLNIDQSLTAVHPVVRTNPVTGWKAIFAVGHHAQFINELTPLESTQTLDFLNNLISKNHDLQVSAAARPFLSKLNAYLTTGPASIQMEHQRPGALG
jgi:alpha-ketoglutarate-dependent taurine dioxygenase